MAYKNISEIPAEKFTLAQRDEKISDQKFETKPVGYFKDAFLRFKKNKSSLAAAVIIMILFLFAIIVPFVSDYDVTVRDGYYALMTPKSRLFAGLGWDGCKMQTETQAGYEYYNSIGQEYGESAVKEVKNVTQDANTGNAVYNIKVDGYDKVGFIYADLSKEEYEALQAYQNETGLQVIYPMPANYKTNFIAVTSSANLWYELADNSTATAGGSAHHDEEGNPVYVANYLTSENKNRAGYESLRLATDDGGEDGNTWFVYAVKNQSGYHVRLLYKEYYHYKNGVEPMFLFGTNQHGQDILVCLANGARLSFILAISVSFINFIIGIAYGAVEGYYGGAVDLFMERISDILASVPFIVVATLFQMHLATKVGPVWSLLFAFVLTGWIGIASRVRTQFYRFKNSEYVLAARTLGARDSRLIFRHILPNSLGTIITGTILIIPNVIFQESMLSYLGIISLETSSLTSIGTMLAGGRAYLSTYPHVIFFPAIFISLLEISFNLFGNGLRDAFNPSLRGADE
ncbi:MAG: ABC transporter permease [Lachnospiraceae bacterium]|jgi:oligopeptide transport system permease protein|nr:ABC transporter permease [Lachnospiraceae bacterium]